MGQTIFSFPFPKRNRDEERGAMFGFTKTTTICAYKSNTKKHVVVLSTMHHSVDKDITSKPEIVESYNSTKGDVDSMDQMCHKFTTKRKTNRWPMLLFYDFLDLASIASIVCWRERERERAFQNTPCQRKKFNIAIRRELVRPQIERRSALTNISLYLRSILTTALSVYSADEARQEELVEEEAHTAKKHGRCHVCPRRKDTKKVQRCSSCNNFVCKSNVKEQVVYQNCC